MALLTAETFSLQFNNKRHVNKRGVNKPYYPRKALLCYQLMPQNGSTPTRGHLKNKKKEHAEIRFINKIKSMGLDETQCYQVTCYLTWSPCPSCAGKLVDFIKAHHHLNLRIFASRLYYHWRPNYQEGLLLLCGSQVPVEVMGLPAVPECGCFREWLKKFAAWTRNPLIVNTQLKMTFPGACQLPHSLLVLWASTKLHSASSLPQTWPHPSTEDLSFLLLPSVLSGLIIL
uniref:single-stranded DNA cytosine deaminase n=1 Tax=Theropithecus gelada TaxID=9565 RepID=A0A8D2EZJ4_THEGE